MAPLTGLFLVLWLAIAGAPASANAAQFYTEDLRIPTAEAVGHSINDSYFDPDLARRLYDGLRTSGCGIWVSHRPNRRFIARCVPI